MCGRFHLKSNLSQIAEHFGVARGLTEPWTPRYNIAPMQPVLCIRETDQREFFTPTWGLIPSWSADAKIATSCINARAESVDTRPAFQSAFRFRRCLVVADGFYEWRMGDRVPHTISLKSGEPMAMAGLWETWESPDGPIETCTICTTNANSLVRPLHNRMPLILPRESIDLWLNPKITDAKKIKSLLQQCPSQALQCWPVGKAVDNVKNQGPQLIDPIDQRRTLKFD